MSEATPQTTFTCVRCCAKVVQLQEETAKREKRLRRRVGPTSVANPDVAKDEERKFTESVDLKDRTGQRKFTESKRKRKTQFSSRSEMLEFIRSGLSGLGK